MVFIRQQPEHDACLLSSNCPFNFRFLVSFRQPSTINAHTLKSIYFGLKLTTSTATGFTPDWLAFTTNEIIATRSLFGSYWHDAHTYMHTAYTREQKREIEPLTNQAIPMCVNMFWICFSVDFTAFFRSFHSQTCSIRRLFGKHYRICLNDWDCTRRSASIPIELSRTEKTSCEPPEALSLSVSILYLDST